MSDLQRLLQEMDVPEQRLADPRWLLRNLGIRNQNHPNFQKAVALIKTMVSDQ